MTFAAGFQLFITILAFINVGLALRERNWHSAAGWFSAGVFSVSLTARMLEVPQ